jgi:hypothetical protein
MLISMNKMPRRGQLPSIRQRYTSWSSSSWSYAIVDGRKSDEEAKKTQIKGLAGKGASYSPFSNADAS